MKIGIIGTGVIATAIVTGFCTKKTGHEFFLSPRNAEKASALAAEFPEVIVCTSNQEVIDRADWVFICLQKVSFGVLGELKFKSTHKVINIAAEMRLPDLRNTIGETALLAHVIPLPVITEGYGPILVYPEIAEVGELFAPVGTVHFAKTQSDVHALQIVTGIMSAYNMLLNEIVMYSDEQGLDHDVSVGFLCSLFNSLCTRAANIKNCDLVELAHEMTPGGYNEQAMNELVNNGAIKAWRTTLDNLHTRLNNSGK
jgi:pyrroline-5-carboxylate reductase